MLRPERMSKVSVAGSKSVMDDVIETLHDLNLVHVSDYDGSWEGFENGESLEGADEGSERLVQIRSIENILEVDEGDADTRISLDDDELETRLEELRHEVNDLEDERSEVRDDLRQVREQKSQVEPFVELGIDLELLSGYDSIEVEVGETDDVESLRSELVGSEEVEEYEVFGGDGLVAVAASLSEDETHLADVLVNTDFSAVEVPDAEGSPEDLVQEFEAREAELESRLEEIDEKREELKQEAAEFLLAAEEKLSIEVQKSEIPLQFATTENSFVAEGWIPTERLERLRDSLKDAVGDHVEIREIERAEYDEHHHDGEEPPVVQDNPSPSKPFELFVNVLNKPKYFELDPTVILLLTFPLFYGFMIGDVGYGALYTAIGYGMYSRLDSDALRSLGGVAMWAGGFTFVFGILYGEIFGLHMGSLPVLGSIYPHPVLHKGLNSDWALVWLVASVFVALVHLNIGYVFGFINDLDHGFRDAFLENLSWLLLMDGLWIWVLSKPKGLKPGFLLGTGSVLNQEPVALGFTGFPATVGLVALVIAAIGFVGVLAGEAIAMGGGIGALVGGLESLNVLVNVLSYARISAVLLAKAGMAFTVNLLFFGVYVTGTGSHSEWHFAITHLPHVGDKIHGHEVTEIMFPGLIHTGVAGLLVGIVVLLLGHALVLALGVTSAGLQAVRLEYVEFFGKFYEGGGDKYQPFGHKRKYITEE